MPADNRRLVKKVKKIVGEILIVYLQKLLGNEMRGWTDCSSELAKFDWGDFEFLVMFFYLAWRLGLSSDAVLSIVGVLVVWMAKYTRFKGL